MKQNIKTLTFYTNKYIKNKTLKFLLTMQFVLVNNNIHIFVYEYKYTNFSLTYTETSYIKPAFGKARVCCINS